MTIESDYDFNWNIYNFVWPTGSFLILGQKNHQKKTFRKFLATCTFAFHVKIKSHKKFTKFTSDKRKNCNMKISHSRHYSYLR